MVSVGTYASRTTRRWRRRSNWVRLSCHDAARYLRIFNPVIQATRFDPQGTYVREWVPELAQLSYPRRLVDHGLARIEALAALARAERE
jgi:deoxyribodipyrimidine photo-lyase